MLFDFLTSTIAPVFYKLLFMSVTALVIGVIVMLIRRFADKKLSPFWKYALWIVVLAALVLPWRLQSNLSVMNNTERLQEVSFRADYETAKIEYQDAQIAHIGGSFKIPEPSEQLLETKAKVDSLHIKTLIFDSIIPAVWLFGTLGFGLFMLLGWLQLKRKIKGSIVQNETKRYLDILQKCKKRLNIARYVAVVFQSHVKTPALFGVFRPKIILPDYSADMSNENLEYIILHELSHLKRGDSFVNALLLALQTVYWFNPLTWVLFKFIREDMEVANDSAVLKNMEKEEQKAYSLSLVEVLAKYSNPKIIPKLLCMVDSEKNIERRITMIKLGEFFKRRKLIIAISGVLVIAITATLFLTVGASGFSTANWEVYSFADEKFDEVFFECSASQYNPEYVFIDAQLMNNKMEYTLQHGGHTSYFLAKRTENDWRVVPYKKGTFPSYDLVFNLEPGESYSFTIEPKMFSGKLDEGVYRIFTPIWFHNADGTEERHTIWAEFEIDKNAPKQETSALSADWIGNPGGKEMTLDDLREIAKTIPELSLKELIHEYGCVNVSNGNGYNMLFSCKAGSLQVIADSNYKISRMTFKIQEADMALDLLTEAKHLDDYINGKYLPLLSEQQLPPLTLEQSISKAILENNSGYADKVNIELHKTLLVEETGEITKAYAIQSVHCIKWDKCVDMGWTDNPIDRGIQFITSSGGGSAIICTFKKDNESNYLLQNFQELDPKGNHVEYTEFVNKTGFDTTSSGVPEKPSDILFRTGWGDPISSNLGKYLPENIFTQTYMPDFKQVFGSDGSICYYWNKTQNSQTVRKIELELCDEGVARFHFKDYGIDDRYVYKTSNINKNTALTLVKNFAKDFWQNSDKLSFKNEGVGYQTLYDPGNIESWQAEYNGKTYIVMVNLRVGFIQYADMQG